ncbi:hypothetical protein AAIR21_27945, partial [Enterobacter sp. PTB]
VPEALTRLAAQENALVLEEEALLEDQAVGQSVPDTRLAEIAQQTRQLTTEQQLLETRYQEEKALVTQLLESRHAPESQPQTAELQQRLHTLQQNSPLLCPDVDVRMVAE